jgi:hypothetical protein
MIKLDIPILSLTIAFGRHAEDGGVSLTFTRHASLPGGPSHRDLRHLQALSDAAARTRLREMTNDMFDAKDRPAMQEIETAMMNYVDGNTISPLVLTKALKKIVVRSLNNLEGVGKHHYPERVASIELIDVFSQNGAWFSDKCFRRMVVAADHGNPDYLKYAVMKDGLSRVLSIELIDMAEKSGTKDLIAYGFGATIHGVSRNAAMLPPP